MKLLYIANSRIPTEKAHGVQIMKMCEAFAENGVDVELIVPRRLNHIKEDPFSFYGVKKNFVIRRLPTLDFVQFGKWGFIVQMWSFAEILFWYLLFRKFDVLYSRDASVLLSPTFLWKDKCFYEAHRGTKSIFTLQVARRSGGVVAISNGVKQFFVSNGVHAEKVMVAHDGIDERSFAKIIDKRKARKQLGLPGDRKIAMYIGSLSEWKGIKTFFEAAGKAEDTLFVVMGGSISEVGELKKKYKNIIFLGSRPYKELYMHQQAADVLVIPNTAQDIVSRKYTSPLKVFAHMASGVPTVSSDVPSLREVLSDENTIFVEPDNPEALASGIRSSISDMDTSLIRAAKAKEEVKKYTWDLRAQAILNLVSNV